jgi:DNA ligase-1
VRRFAALFEALDTTTSTRAKVDAMVDYFRAASPADAAWATYVLMGRRLKRSVGPALLHAWLVEEAQLPAWLVEETYGSIGDLAETIALLVAPDSPPPSLDADLTLTAWFEQRLLPLAKLDDAEKRRLVVGWWHGLAYRECFLVSKLLTGALRVGVSRLLVTRALATLFDNPRVHVERAVMGEWQPTVEFWQSLARNEASVHVGHPYPFYLASPLEGSAEQLGAREQWLAEWKWDGIRGQIVRRAGQCSVWSRGEDIIGERFPEIVATADLLPDGTVLDGEVLAWADQQVLPFAQLQQRIGRRKLTPKILKEIPVRFVSYDLLEHGGEDWRARPLRERRAQLERVVQALPGSVITLSPSLSEPDWRSLADARELARSRGVEGLMLKNLDSPYGTGRQRGAWWKWKINPFLFDGVLLYAAPGHGRRSNLYTDYTFAVWNGTALVPVAKAYSGLTDKEIGELDRWIRTHTREKFGIVRSVEPFHVFELAYEGIAKSTRHKSGIALRFPRINRWRHDKVFTEADTLENLQQVLQQSAPGSLPEPV